MRRSIDRRHFLRSSFAVGAGLAFGRFPNFAGASEAKTTQLQPAGFFTLGQRDGHWWLIRPDGTPFYTMGLNHIDPASLRYPENIHLWRDKYAGSTLTWIKESVAPNLKDWGFNTVGWVQEVTVRKWRHSRAFTGDEYRALAMPYCHLLPFMESHQWEKHTVHYDFRSEDWPQLCDYVARSHCAELSEDPNLIGYFYSDCPTWTHSLKLLCPMSMYSPFRIFAIRSSISIIGTNKRGNRSCWQMPRIRQRSPTRTVSNPMTVSGIGEF
jgi:hypothetical protein